VGAVCVCCRLQVHEQSSCACCCAPADRAPAAAAQAPAVVLAGSQPDSSRGAAPTCRRLLSQVFPDLGSQARLLPRNPAAHQRQIQKEPSHQLAPACNVVRRPASTYMHEATEKRRRQHRHACTAASLWPRADSHPAHCGCSYEGVVPGWASIRLRTLQSGN